ncbi:MAG: hypothetical protein GXP42_13975 [Chloroflexi bacterium]|nr:hypothetical protein [Chloroflexota bacterium]
MSHPIVACIQHRLIVPKTPGEYVTYLGRFLRTAKAKGAELALFPELSGLATVIPTFTGWRNSLLITAGQTKHRKAGIVERVRSKLAGGAAGVVRADLRRSLLEMTRAMPESLHDSYVGVFAALAQQYEMTIVAGSMYDVDPHSGAIQNVSLVFGPDGELLGRQAKVMLSDDDVETARAADGWGVIPTPVGKVGILIGKDALYPEPARILAYQGADMLLTMAAVARPATYHKIYQAALARCQENQLYGMVSFLVGENPFAGENDAPFVGRSAIFAPLEFTPRFTGVMVQLGSPLAEGVITAEWDYDTLRAWWDESDTPLRREMPMAQAAPILAALYRRALPLAEAEQLMLPPGFSVEEQVRLIEEGPMEEPPTEEKPTAEEEMEPWSLVSPVFPVTPLAPTEPEAVQEELEALGISPAEGEEAHEKQEAAEDMEESAPDEIEVRVQTVEREGEAEQEKVTGQEEEVERQGEETPSAHA